jgi:transposase
MEKSKHPKLSPKHRNRILRVIKKSKDRVICDQAREIYLADLGIPLQDIATVLMISLERVKCHLDEYFNGKYDKDGKCFRNHLGKLSGGSAPKLSLQQSEKLDLYCSGIQALNVDEIRSWVQTQLGISLSRTAIRNWLQKHDYRYVKPPTALPAVAPELQVQHLVKHQEIQRILKENPQENLLFYIDSVHPTMASKPAFGWIKKNADFALKASKKARRVNITGAWNPESMELISFEYYKTVDALTFEHFLSFLREEVDKKTPDLPQKTIYCILDNGSAHRAVSVAEYAENNKIILIFLPPYSPNLNPIERVWRIMNRLVRNNINFENYASFCDAIRRFLAETWDNIKEEMRKWVNENFHLNPRRMNTS